MTELAYGMTEEGGAGVEQDKNRMKGKGGSTAEGGVLRPPSSVPLCLKWIRTKRGKELAEFRSKIRLYKRDGGLV